MRGGRPSAVVVLGLLLVVALALGHRDQIRARAERALDSGMPAREAALARGFVLGEDERIDAATVEDFRRSGLSHLLAVSGQNVALLALLAMPLLALLGMSLRARLLWIVAAIAVYVPLAGGGPSIVRAGVMGALTLLATFAGRRASRLYALAIAAIVTLAIDPRIGADVGWQLSFAAVLGILAIARPLRRAIASRLGPGGLRGALAEGTAVTVAATLATAPLIVFHFGELSTVSLVANLLALPAVAPAMWLGMLSSIGAQVPGFPGGASQRDRRAPARLHRHRGELVRAAALGLLEVEIGRSRPGRFLRRPGGGGDRRSRAAAPAPHRGTAPRTNPRRSGAQRLPAAPEP